MAIQPLKTYDLDEVNCLIGPTGGAGPVNTDGYSDDGGITFDVSEDVWSLTTGADGLPVVSRNHDKLVVATIAVSQMALVNKRLDAIRQVQQDQKPIEPCPFFLANPLTGDKVKDRWCVVRNVPPPDQEAEAGSREYNLILPNARDQIEHGADISV